MTILQKNNARMSEDNTMPRLLRHLSHDNTLRRENDTKRHLCRVRTDKGLHPEPSQGENHNDIHKRRAAVPKHGAFARHITHTTTRPLGQLRQAQTSRSGSGCHHCRRQKSEPEPPTSTLSPPTRPSSPIRSDSSAPPWTQIWPARARTLGQSHRRRA